MQAVKNNKFVVRKNKVRLVFMYFTNYYNNTSLRGGDSNNFLQD